jgi:hypothetical protein
MRLLGLSHHRERRLARMSRAEDERLLRAHVDDDDRRFEDAMRCRAPGPTLLLGATDTVPYVLPIRDVIGSFGWLTATTGGGKTYFTAGLVDQLLGALARRNARAAVALLDMKGEMSDLVLRAATALAARLAPAEREAFISRITVLRFFKGDYLPEWQLLVPQPGVSPVVQAHAIAETIEATVGAAMGPHQTVALTWLLALAIEAGLSLLELRWLLYDHDRVVRIAERSAIPEARLFVTARLGRAARVTIDGIAARLDALLRVDAIKASLAGPAMLDLRRCFLPGHLTILDFGGAPLGAEGGKRALATLAFTRLTWAGFDESRPRGNQTWIIADEIQEGLTPASVGNVKRIVTTGRSFGIGFWSIHQSAAQLPADLKEILATDIQFRIVGRSGEADARFASEWLPRTGVIPRRRLPGSPPPERPEFLSEGDEQRHWVNHLGTLPSRQFLVARPHAAFGSRFVTSPIFSPPPWERLDPAVAAAVLKGSWGRPRPELVARARAIEERAAAELEGGRTFRNAVADTPDAVGPQARRGTKAVP